MPLRPIVDAAYEAARHDALRSNDELTAMQLEAATQLTETTDGLFDEIVNVMGTEWCPSEEWQAAARATRGTGLVDQVLRELGCL